MACNQASPSSKSFLPAARGWKFIHISALTLVVIVGVAMLAAQSASPVARENAPPVPSGWSFLAEHAPSNSRAARPVSGSSGRTDEELVIHLTTDWQNTDTINGSPIKPGR